MKKTLVSLAAVAAITTGAMAADKGVDLTTTGQAVVYYETKATDVSGDKGLFHQDNSMANVGLQLNVGGDLGNNFTMGTQLTYLGTLGLEKNLVSGTRADATQSTNNTLNSQIMLNKVFIAKQMGATTMKLGRQELPKSLSPLAYSEGWNVFKNTFDAAVFINSDIPDTTVVAAWVGESNDPNKNYGTMSDLTAKAAGKGVSINSGAYMLTVANKSIPMTAITASYYGLQGIGATTATGASWAIDQNKFLPDGKTVNPAYGTNVLTPASGTDTTGDSGSALWLDVKVAGKSMPLGMFAGVQYGSIATNITGAKDTSAYGVKLGMKPLKGLMVQLAYSDVNDGTVAVKNVGTGIKSPLYTQAIYNQNFISSDASTAGLKAAYNTGGFGKVIAIYNATTDNSAAKKDYSELDLIYKIKSGGVTYWASAMLRSISDDKTTTTKNEKLQDNKVRLWARKAF